jgi:hypothetical protein
MTIPQQSQGEEQYGNLENALANPWNRKASAAIESELYLGHRNWWNI